MAERAGMMTDRQRIEALLNHRKPDRVPIWPFSSEVFAVVNARYPIAAAYNRPENSLEAQRWICEQYGWVFSPMLMYADYGAWEFGGEIKWPSGEFSQAPTVTRYPVETEEDVRNLKAPDVKTAGIIPLVMEFYKLSSQERLDNEPFNVLSFSGSAFTVAGNIAGPDKLCKWMLKKPDVAHRLLRLATDHLIDLTQFWKDTFGIDAVLPMGGEPTSANQLISPKHFEQFALPYVKELNEKILAMGYQHIYEHICGEHSANLPFWVQIPFGDPGIISIGHEIDIETAAKYFPNDIIVGNLDTSIIQIGTPQQVYEATKKVILKGKKCPGGFAFSPGCELPPMSPPLNVWMMTKAVNDFGWYE
jgi:uroporphyrinogen decarboxylase